MLQELIFDDIHLLAEHNEDRPYVIAGPRMYAIGMMSGAPPHVGDEHLVGEMGGLWAHPLKMLDAWGVRINEDFGTVISFKGMFWGVERTRQCGNFLVQELEWIDEEEAALFIRARITNTASHPSSARVAFHAIPHLRPCWMSTLLNGKTIVRESHTGLVAFDSAHPERAIAIAAEGGLRREVNLAPAEEMELRIAVYATRDGGEHIARQRARRLLQEIDSRQARKRRAYEAATRREREHGEDPSLDQAYRCALLNLKLLEANYPLGHYPIAGLPEYPNLFGCDIAYSAPGLCLAGRSDLAIDALRALRNVMMRQCGRTPHEVLPDGNIFHPGNTQETPQFVIAVRRVAELISDKGAFIREMYPACRAGMLNYLRGMFTLARSRFPYYPFGNAMVEREDMAPFKLDSVCYTWRALHDLGYMAQILQVTDGHFDYTDDTRQALDWANRIAAQFEHDWWIEQEGLYADSLDWDGRQQLDYHWTQIVPLEVGLASPEHAKAVLQQIITRWLNEYGMPHTLGRDERVWTLPTAIVAKVAAQQGYRDVAKRLLHNIALTRTGGGQLGMFEELIPHGLCFIQLWSAAMFVEIYELLHEH